MATPDTPADHWLFETEILDSPACAMPQYATYRRHLWLVSGAVCEANAATMEDLLAQSAGHPPTGSRLVLVPVIPFYDVPGRLHPEPRPVGTAPTGGRRGSGCCATLWVPDPDRTYRRAFQTMNALAGARAAQPMQKGADVSGVAASQSWWASGAADRHEALDGFHVECTLGRRHEGLCAGLDLTWDWRDYAPYSRHSAPV